MPRPRILLFVALVAACAGCDLATKGLAEATLEPFRVVTLAGETLRLERVSNPGAFMSLGADWDPRVRGLLLLVLAPALLAALCAALLRSATNDTRALVGLALFAGGGLANWLDRLANGGAVTDFVSLGVGSLRTGIFNLADVAVLSGLAVFLLAQRHRARPASEESATP